MFIHKWIALCWLQVASEQFYYWLLGLRHVCSGQICLQDLNPDHSNILPCLASAIDSYHRALVSFKVRAARHF
jgi:hypothetical protein